MPPGMPAVVTVNWATTTMLRALVAVVTLASSTPTVKFEVPAAVGVPEIMPPVLSVSPGGRLPDAIDHA